MSRNFVYEELNRFIKLDAEDAKRAKEIAPIVLNNFKTIADNVYQDMETDPRTVSAFRTRERIEKHRTSLYEWMTEAFSGVYDRDWYEARHVNGQRHAEVTLFPHFVFGKMTLVRKQIVHTIANSPLPPLKMAAYIDTANRIIDLDLAITIQSYWDTLMVSKLKVPLALSSGLAHEIRNPLNGIGLNLSLLERKLKNIDISESYTFPILDAIRTELGRINSLTSEIMNFAKPVPLDREFISAKDLIEEIMRLQSVPLKEANIALETTFIGPDTIFVDRNRIFQVILNLITNAIESFENKEGDGKEISLTVDNTKGATTTLEIIDNGCGMPPEVRERIFDLYFTTKSAGTGLGMAIVRKIIEAHNGMIRITSVYGEGSTINIFLPRLASEPSIS